MKSLSSEQKKDLLLILSSFLFLLAGFFAGHVIPIPDHKTALILSVIFYLIAYLLSGLEIVIEAFKGIAHGEMLDECFLMTIATVGAFVLGEYAEGVAVMLFYRIGEFFQDYAVGRSRRSISSLLDLRADRAWLEKDGEVLAIEPASVQIGDVIVIRPGEKIPLDGVILEGRTTLNTAALTGESLPQNRTVGDEVLSGCINGEGLIRVRVQKTFGESTASKILELVENAGEKKSKSENFISKFARIYTPAVVFAAVAIAVIPPFLFGFESFPKWIFQGLTFLVISCPCALVISIPLTFFGGLGAASRNGILIKGSNYLEALAHLKTVVFDKTGTLTYGTFSVSQIVPAENLSEEELLTLAATAEAESSHPIARSILSAYDELQGEAPDTSALRGVTEVSGNGVTCLAPLGGQYETIAVGNRRLMKTLGIDCDTPPTAGTVVHLAATKGQSDPAVPTERRYLGYLVIADEIRSSSCEAVAELKKVGVKRTVMLTGDSQPVAESVANEVGITSFSAELLPQGKVEAVEALLREEKEGRLAFVGDGLNDAPVLSRADIGVAMGGIGSDAAIEAADVVLMDDDLRKLPLAVRIAEKTLKIAHGNIIFALAVKALILILGLLGHADMWLAVFADVGVSLLAILNAMRTMRIKK